MDRQLEAKKDSLSLKLFHLKEDYLKMKDSNIHDTNIIKNSLMKQIEVLTELINTIKIKINLIQQTEAVV